MAEYRAYAIGSQGQIMGRTEFSADDDAAALAHARLQILSRTIEVWHGDRLVGTLESDTSPNGGGSGVS